MKFLHVKVLSSVAFVSLQVIAEGANGPTTPAAEKVLIENNKLVIPVSPLTSDSTPRWFFSHSTNVASVLKYER